MNADGDYTIQDGRLIQSKEAKFWNLKLMQLHSVKGPMKYFMNIHTLFGPYEGSISTL